jgi:hypothetical protein
MDFIYVMVSGCRHYTAYWQFAKRMDALLKDLDRDKVVIIEGGARGTDYLAYLYARRRKLMHATYEADWDEFGKSAGFIRNAEMMEVARFGAAFWDGSSKGTKHVVQNATKYDVSLRVVTIPEENPHGKKRRGNGAWRKKNGGVISWNG